MAAPLTGLGRRGVWPAPQVCRACGSTRDASRGFPGDVWYCAAHVPPELRSPGEPGYAPPPPSADLPAIAAPPAPTPALDLLSGLAPA